MNETFNYRLVDTVQTLLASFSQGSAGDSAIITIYDVDDAVVDVSGVAMTNINATDWKYSWTPSENHVYLITYRNVTLDVDYKEYVKVVGSIVGVPGGSGTGSMFSVLISDFLKGIDNYNANDLTGTNSSGELAGICINRALQTIYSDIKQSRYLDAYASTALVSTIDQSYIELSAVSDLDELMALKDTTNQWTLEEIPKWKYFAERPDPSIVTGTPTRFCRIFNRIYLDPRPTAAITYTTEFKKTYAYLSAGTDVALIPAKFNPWIYAEAYVIWLMGEDITAVGAIGIAQRERERVRDIFLSDIGSQFAYASQSRSGFRRNGLNLNPYDHAV